jgi:hypothetical protein
MDNRLHGEAVPVEEVERTDNGKEEPLGLWS